MKDQSFSWIIPLVYTVVVAGMLVIGCGQAHAYTADEYVNAIYKAEGGAKAQYPYGIRSVKCSTTLECRKICRNSVRNNLKRYQDAISLGTIAPTMDFVVFMGQRYSPPAINPNWVKLVNYFLTKGTK